jgi:enoyl-CoA hydratase/carnithine racemase
MVVERAGGLAVVRFPKGAGLYERRSDDAVLQLTAFAEDLHRSARGGRADLKGVLVLQNGPATDVTPAWLADLRDEALLKELAKAIDARRWLLSLVRNSPIPWCYAAADDCQGSHWELALSCQLRYWFSPAAQLGFPEVAAGAFPPGGVLESLSKRAGRTKDRWSSLYLFPAAEALGEKLVDYCVDAGDWQSEAEAVFRALLAANPKAGVRASGRQRFREAFDLTGDLASRQAAFGSLELVWKKDREAATKPPSAWDYGWELVKERSRIKDPTDLGRLIAHIAARHYLSPGYLAWLECSLAERGPGGDERSFSLPSAVAVDLDELAPPVEALKRLLENGVVVVFVASDPKALAAGLNLIYGRLERALGAQRAQTLWERQVSWSVGGADARTAAVMRWLVDDRVEIEHRASRLAFVRLEGDAGQAAAGLLEWRPQGEALAAEGAAMAVGVAALISDGFVRTEAILPGPLPLAVIVRSLLLEELVRIAPRTGDLAGVVEGLALNGWRFAGSEESWDRFLRTRVEAYGWDAELPHVMGRAADRQLWEMGGWKMVRAHARRSGGDAEPRWNATALSQHVATFVGLVATALGVGHAPSARVDAEILCAKAVGMPAAFGTPTGFLRRRGRRRIEHNVGQNWPDYPIQKVWSDDT